MVPLIVNLLPNFITHMSLNFFLSICIQMSAIMFPKSLSTCLKATYRRCGLTLGGGSNSHKSPRFLSPSHTESHQMLSLIIHPPFFSILPLKQDQRPLTVYNLSPLGIMSTWPLVSYFRTNLLLSAWIFFFHSFFSLFSSYFLSLILFHFHVT